MYGGGDREREEGLGLEGGGEREWYVGKGDEDGKVGGSGNGNSVKAGRIDGFAEVR